MDSSLIARRSSLLAACGKFPLGAYFCAARRLLDVFTLYVNSITSNIPGKHKALVRLVRTSGHFIFTFPVSVDAGWSSASTRRPPTPPLRGRAAARSSTSRARPSVAAAAAHAAACSRRSSAASTAAGGWERIELIAVGIGPGTFTGLRVGIATARALGPGAGLPLAGVGSLAALARGSASAAAGARRAAVLDARRGEVFAALYAPAASGLGPLVGPPGGARRAPRGAARAPAGGRIGSLRFREELSRGVEVPATGTRRTGWPLATYAPSRRRASRGAEPARPDLSETAGCGGMA